MSSNTTRLLKSVRSGDGSAFDELFSHVYDELRVIARHRLASRTKGQTIATTVLVHEAYIKLVDGAGVDATDRAHFLALASRAMRFILVDEARAKGADKRGGGVRAIDLDEVQVAGADAASAELITLNDALERLSEMDERLGRVVECRFFGGMEYEEVAEALGVSVPTAKRDWARARAWLYDFMTEGEERGTAES